jgi:hypothetical protein
MFPKPGERPDTTHIFLDITQEEVPQLINILEASGWQGCDNNSVKEIIAKAFRVYANRPGICLDSDRVIRYGTLYPKANRKETDFLASEVIVTYAGILTQWNCKCPKCGRDAYLGLNAIECSKECEG